MANTYLIHFVWFDGLFGWSSLLSVRRSLVCTLFIAFICLFAKFKTNTHTALMFNVSIFLRFSLCRHSIVNRVSFCCSMDFIQTYCTSSTVSIVRFILFVFNKLNVVFEFMSHAIVKWSKWDFLKINFMTRFYKSALGLILITCESGITTDLQHS